MAEINTVIAEASQDLQTIEDFVNLPAGSDVRPRLLPSVNVGTLAGTRDAIFEAGGLPANPFATKALMTASALVDGKYAMVTDDTVNNGLYVKTAGAWVKSAYDPVTTAVKYSVGRIDVLRNSLVISSNNLFNADTASLNKFILSDGEVVDSSTGYHISDFIPVNVGSYTVSAKEGLAESFRTVFYYDTDKNFIRSTTFTAGSNPAVFTITDPNIGFVRFNMRSGLPGENQRMLNRGLVALPYEPFKRTFKDVDFNERQLESIKDGLDITDSAKPFLKNSDSYNLFNYKKVTEGLLIGLDGEEAPNVSYFTTDYIPIKPSTSYSISNDIGVNGFNLTSYYDENKVFIKRINSTTSVSGFYSWKSPANAHFVRLSSNWKDPTKYNRMFIEGDVPLAYKSGVPVLEDIKLGDNVISDIAMGATSNTKPLPYIYDRDLNDIFTLEAGFSDYTDWGSRTAAQVYSLYDDLVATHGDYITKYELTPDGLGNPIAYYHFKPAKPITHTTTKLPNVVIVTGQHGFEKASVLSTYLFAEQLCQGWKDSSVMEAMRFGAEFYILPLANPSGFNANTYGNHNQVNINRNYPWNWVSVASFGDRKYSGPSAASEIETQNVIELLDSLERIDICYDFHNFQKSLERYLWVSIGDDSNELIQRMSQSFISRMTNNWRKEYTWVTQDESWFAGYMDSTSNPTGGVLGNYVRNVHGVKLCGTFEVCDNWTINPALTKYGVELTKTGVEALVNWLAINLYYLNETL